MNIFKAISKVPGMTALSMLFGSLAFVPVPQVYAQGSMLEEIVVTSRRYEESLEDAPLAINVMDSGFLVNQRIEKADDIFEMTPGATYESFSKQQPVATMRGVIAPTPGNSSSEASIQTVVDNVVITKDFMKSPALFDLSRVEVLRGPQGTSFGRNASVGLIHFVTNKPVQETEGGINVTVGVDEKYQVDGFYNMPFSDTLAGRIAFNWDDHDGDTESRTTGEGLDGEGNTTVRGSLMWEPTDNFSAYLKLEAAFDDDEAPVRHGVNCTGGLVHPTLTSNLAFVSGQDTGGGPYAISYFDDCDDPFTQDRSATPGVEGDEFDVEREIYTVVAELVWDLGNDLTVTSITGYMKANSDSLMDLIGTLNDVSYQETQNEGDSFSQEIRIDNQGAGNRLSWLAGLYYMTDEEDRFEENKFQPNNARIPPVAMCGGPGCNFVPTYIATISNNVTDSISVFGEITYDLNDRLALTSGGRWVKDEKDYTYGVRASGVNRQIGGVPGVGPGIDGVAQICPANNMGPPSVCGSRANPLGFSGEKVSDDWSDYISKVSLSYEMNDNLNFYALYSEGFKSGTFQPDARSRAEVNVVVAPETSTNYEVGVKGATDTLRYSIVGFFLKNKNTQTINLVPVAGGFTGLISNVGAVETSGIEVEATWLATDSFLLGGTAALLDSELKNTPDPTGLIDPNTGAILDISGHRPAGAPEWTATIFGEYDFALANGSSLTLRADWRGRSDVYNQTSERLTNLRLRPEISDVGVRLTWTSPSENFRISAWGDHLREDYDIENFGPPSPCCNSFSAGFRGKRVYGVSANYNF